MWISNEIKARYAKKFNKIIFTADQNYLVDIAKTHNRPKIAEQLNI